jgi:hypothetical protein
MTPMFGQWLATFIEHFAGLEIRNDLFIQVLIAIDSHHTIAPGSRSLFKAVTHLELLIKGAYRLTASS